MTLCDPPISPTCGTKPSLLRPSESTINYAAEATVRRARDFFLLLYEMNSYEFLQYDAACLPCLGGHCRWYNQVASNQHVLSIVSRTVHLMPPWACNEGHIGEKGK